MRDRDSTSDSIVRHEDPKPTLDDALKSQANRHQRRGILKLDNDRLRKENERLREKLQVFGREIDTLKAQINRYGNKK